jgi:dipeptidyl aminopeptidase/acylaminoacyl peptidase
MRARLPAVSLALLLSVAPAHAESPTLEQMISLKRASAPAASPDGRFVAYAVRDTDWVKNAFVTQVWLADVEAGTSRQLTFGEKSSFAPAWSPDGLTLAFLSERGEKRQVWRLDMRGGEAEKLTGNEEGVNSFAWSPDGSSLAYAAGDGKSDERKERDKRLGEIERHGSTNLWLQPLGGARAKRLTTGTWAVGRFSWSPDGKRIAFDHQAHDALAVDSTKDISVLDVAGGKVTRLVSWKGPDANPVWSPDGATIAFETIGEQPGSYYANDWVATVPATGGTPTVLTRELDEDPLLIAWTREGIYLSVNQRTATYLMRLDPATRRTERLAPGEGWAGFGWSVTADGAWVAFVAGDAAHYPEVFVGRPGGPTRAVTKLGEQLAGWTLGTSEVVEWTSQDGTRIEGVLRKPAGWKPGGAPRPLLVLIHGGPTATSRPTRFGATYVYPVEHWLAKGALVLEPNYRGSAGYGAAFRGLNVRNLGVGDAWDVVAGIESLVRQGVVDSSRVGAMGWSQGGYISAFLATNESRRFRAISVGAGISNWMTYYVNTDITPFTRQYLQSTPWDDPELYARTSPITNVRQGAGCPVLIQHGSNDARVPAPNARELYRALVDVGVEAKLTMFPGFGHGLNKPKAVLAAMEENRDWFDTRVFATPPKAKGSPARQAAMSGRPSKK